jgi:hypothetical protein
MFRSRAHLPDKLIFADQYLGNDQVRKGGGAEEAGARFTRPFSIKPSTSTRSPLPTPPSPRRSRT